jgi:hypothetical protein
LPDADLALAAASPALWLLSSIINVGLVRRFAASLYTVTGSARTAESALPGSATPYSTVTDLARLRG